MQLRQVLKKKIKMASIYRSLNEGYFEAAEALVFAEINAELPYVSASYITGKCSVLVNCDRPKRLQGFIEHAIWNQTVKMHQSADQCLFITAEENEQPVKSMKYGEAVD